MTCQEFELIQKAAQFASFEWSAALRMAKRTRWDGYPLPPDCEALRIKYLKAGDAAHDAWEELRAGRVRG